MQDGIAVEAGGGGAGVDGQDAQAAARRQGGAGRPADDAVFLIGLRDAQAGDQVPGLVADEPVAELLQGRPVSRERAIQPASMIRALPSL